MFGLSANGRVVRGKGRTHRDAFVHRTIQDFQYMNYSNGIINIKDLSVVTVVTYTCVRGTENLFTKIH